MAKGFMTYITGLALGGWMCVASSMGAKAQDRLSAADRVAFRTNMAGWILATPNIGVQYDVTSKPYNKWTLGAEVKWNPGTVQTYTPKYDYSMTDVKIEARRYFRENLELKQGQKRMPKFWRAYYWGLYAEYTDYTIFLKNGYTGEHAGAGFSAGWEIPVVKFAKGALDLDFGLSAGWIYGKSKKRVEKNGTYVFENEKDWHFTPYPILTDVRVALVYRFKSVKEKYKSSKR